VERYDFDPTSDATAQYNCISWALSYDRQAIWPDEDRQLAWPDFRKLFELCGFSHCLNGDIEAGHEKIVLMGGHGVVMHASRQIKNGRWTSKLGAQVDGEHPSPDTLRHLYGDVLLWMKRQWTGGPPRLPDLNPPPARLIGPHGGPLVR
jgi:hypothetical protein